MQETYNQTFLARYGTLNTHNNKIVQDKKIA